MEPKLLVSRKIAEARLEKQIADGEKLLKRHIEDSAAEYQQFQNDVMLWKSSSAALVGTLFDTDEIKRGLSFSSAVALPRSPIPMKWEQINRETNFFLLKLRAILNNLSLYKLKRPTRKKKAASNKVLRKRQSESNWDVFISHASEDKKQPQTGNLDKEGKPTQHTAQVLNILIASPSDVSEEREVVERAIRDWNASHFSSMGIMLNPIRWESHAYPASGDRPQAIINRQIVESGDILIAIFGYKLGTPTGAAQSGTIEEIEEFRKAGKYVALYFSTADVPRSADRAQLEALESYKKDRQKDTLYFEFEDASDLRDHLTRHLPKIVHEVHEKLNLSSLAKSPGPELSGQVKNANSKQSHEATHSLTSLADIISELEDNLDCASRPRTGDVYRRPSTRVWLEIRNKITLPPDIYLRVKNIYNRIGSWGDVVASGLNPNLGSMELNLIVSDLRSSLPPLIDELRKLQNPGRSS